VLKFFKGGRKLTGSVRSNVSRQDFSREAVRSAVHASLQRLRTDYLDIFLLHSPPPEVMADRQLFDLLREIKQEGKIRHFGVSSPEFSVSARDLTLAGVSVVQTPINPAHNVAQNPLRQFESEKIGVIANQIFLSGKWLGTTDAAKDENNFRQLRERLETLASTKGISLRRLLIEFALIQPGIVSVLTGTTSPEHLKQNVADALSARVLSAAESERITREHLAAGAVQ
jgi:aryl-alcohol dehydrogenase-like predicted oxidoreductase